jgi:hypothetical protein
MTWRKRVVDVLDEIDAKADHLDLLLILGVVCLAAHLFARLVYVFW